MDKAAADWVYDVVLTRAYKDSRGCLEEGRGAEHLRTCPCFWGRCGHCGGGRPDRCAHRDGRAGPGRAPAARVLDRSGGVLEEVWVVGRNCKWNCPGPDLRTMSTPELFALAGAS